MKNEPLQLRDPWLLAVWPGMGGVAANAGAYLVNALGASLEAQLSDSDLFDVAAVNVSEGLISPLRKPRNMFFAWQDPHEQHDLLIFVGEAQPSRGGSILCNQVLDYATKRGVSRVLTFAAMATQVHPTETPRVFTAATREELLGEIAVHGAEPLPGGQIGGLNGALLGAAAERGIDGFSLLGEMPFYAVNLPNPKSTLSVLRVFADVADVYLDLSALAEQAETVEPKLVELFDRLASQAEHDGEPDEPWAESLDEPVIDDKPTVDHTARQRIEHLFEEALKDRANAIDLKKELDRLGVFDEYEDRFLDLFKHAA